MAGSEAAWQAAERGIRVFLYEMRPEVSTGAHTGGYLAELVCSNSLGSNLPDRASGVLKDELRKMGSMVLRSAEETAVPAGRALAVDRGAFARKVTDNLSCHPNIRVIRQEMSAIPERPAIIASGPLTSPSLAQAISELTGSQHLYFYDAIAPIVEFDTIDPSIAFRASRYARGEQEAGDYINCPFTRDEYEAFVDALLQAQRFELREFERDLESGVKAGAHHFFEGCLPVEIIARRGRDSLAFGPMRPVGLVNPHTGRWPYAVVQLRQDNLAGSLYNLVGFQTNLKFPEQRRVFRMIPGLERAEFARYGQMHRNTFIFSPANLRPSLQFHSREDLFFAGQITGVEGYVGNIATGLLAGWNAARVLQGERPLELPATTMLGALCQYICNASEADFQPMKANFGILPPLQNQDLRGKRQRAAAYASRAAEDLAIFLKDRTSRFNLNKNRVISGFLLIVLFATMLACSQASVAPQIPSPTPTQSPPKIFDGQKAWQDVDYQVSLGPRTPGSEAHQKAVDWMISELKSAGWSVQVQELTLMGHPIQNIVAEWGSGHPWIVLGAHYDSRLLADQDPNPQNRKLPVPGANDGASGVAVLLELARILPSNFRIDNSTLQPAAGVVPARKITLLFIDAEDNGEIPGWDWLLGSQAYNQQWKTANVDRPDAAVIIDMIGDKDLNIYRELNSDPTITNEIWAQAQKLGYSKQFINQPKYRMVDDHIPFIKAGIPAVDIIDFDYPYWHTTADTADKVSAESLQVVGDTLAAWLTQSYSRNC